MLLMLEATVAMTLKLAAVGPARRRIVIGPVVHLVSPRSGSAIV